MTATTSFIALASLMIAASLAWLLQNAHANRTAGATSPRARRVTRLSLIVVVPVLTALLYAHTGRLDALSPGEADPLRAQAEERTERLAGRLASQPDDAGLRLLARSYEELRRFADAAAIRARLVALHPEDPDEAADLAEALAMTQGGRYIGRPTELARQVLARDALQPKALAIAANAAAQRGDFAEAIVHWEKLGDLVPESSDVGRSIRDNIADARQAIVRAANDRPALAERR